MDITLEQVERLREKANISYEEAKAVLEEAGGSLLDALILLEQRGKIHSDAGKSAHYSTRPGSNGGPDAGASEAQGEAEEENARFLGIALITDGSRVKGFFQDLLRRSLDNSLEVWRRGELMTSIPLLIAVLLILVAFGITIPLLIIGLLLGCRYRLAGPDFDRSPAGATVNRAATTVGDTVDRMKEQAREYFHETHRNKK